MQCSKCENQRYSKLSVVQIMKHLKGEKELKNCIDFFARTAYNISEQRNLFALSALLL